MLHSNALESSSVNIAYKIASPSRCCSLSEKIHVLEIAYTLSPIFGTHLGELKSQKTSKEEAHPQFNQQIFSEHFRYARHCSKCWEFSTAR